MKGALSHLFGVFVSLGGFGLLILGILDSSFLVMPLGNDLLIIALTARNHARLPWYVAMATGGSVIGCFIIDLISRKGGEQGLEKLLPRGRIEYVKRKVTNHAAWALALASIMPPPFPFTPFVIGSAALQYPRKKLLPVIGVSRLIRFSIEGALAIVFGRSIIRLMKSPAVWYTVIAVIVISIGASAFSVYGWIRRARAFGPRAR